MMTISLQTLSETFLSLRRIQWDIITNVHESQCKVPVTLVRFKWNLNILKRCSKIYIYIYLIPWKSVQWELICSMWMDRRWDMTKLKVAFCNFVYTSDIMYYQRHDQKMYLQKLTELFRFSPDLPEHKYTEDELPHPVADMCCTIWSHKLQHLYRQWNFPSSYICKHQRLYQFIRMYVSMKHSTCHRTHNKYSVVSITIMAFSDAKQCDFVDQ